MIKTIGFFGDSFCEYTATPHSIFNNYKTYLKLLAEHYNCQIVHQGVGGSSAADVCLLQVPQMINNMPDICVFVWTDYGRLFNKQVRKINCSTVDEFHVLNRSIWKAANQYYKHLYDDSYHAFVYKSMLLYFDQEVLSKLTDKKIIHLWAFGNPPSWDNDGFQSNTVEYPHRWKHGVEIRPALASLCISDVDYEAWNTSHPANHLDGIKKNTQVFSWIKNAIDNYESGSLKVFNI